MSPSLSHLSCLALVTSDSVMGMQGGRGRGQKEEEVVVGEGGGEEEGGGGIEDPWAPRLP